MNFLYFYIQLNCEEFLNKCISSTLLSNGFVLNVKLHEKNSDAKLEALKIRMLQIFYAKYYNLELSLIRINPFDIKEGVIITEIALYLNKYTSYFTDSMLFKLCI